jgi:arylsulfatase A-like enzyme
MFAGTVARCAAVLVALVAAGTGCGGGGNSAGPPQRLNVLLVTLDTTRADHLGCYGHPAATSPQMDSVARKGVRFDLAIAQAAVTPVSHASILTGLNPANHGVRVLSAATGYRLPAGIPTLASVLEDRGWSTAAFLSAFTVSEHFGFDRGFDLFDNGLAVSAEDVLRPLENGIVDWNTPANQRRSDATTDRAVTWLRHVDEPFLLWVHYWDPHDTALLPPPDVIEDFVTPGLSRPQHLRALYDAEIRYVDEQFGRLVGGLEQQGLADETMIVIVADHGQGLGDHGWWYHRILYQEQLRIPLIIHVPGGPAHITVQDLVRSIDIYPTVLDWLGIDAPHPVDGESLRPLMEGRTEASRMAYADQLNLFDLNAAVVRQRPNDDLVHCAMDRAWKLIYRPRQPQQSELYDLVHDPVERHNLYDPDHHQARRLLRFLEDSGGFVDRPFGGTGETDALKRLRSLGYVD